jgi:integrase
MDGNDLLRLGFYPALRRVGIRRVRLHDLRHSFASNLLATGWDVVTVSKLLGHANPQITLTIYAHALPQRAMALRTRWQSYFGSRVGTVWAQRPPGRIRRPSGTSLSR